MKNLKFSRLFAAMMVVACLALVGCSNEPKEEVSIYGTWACDDGQKFIITSNELKNYWGDNEGYAGDNLSVVEISETEGTIFIKYTRSLDYSSPTYYSENGVDVGKWYAVSYKDLKTGSISISGAYKDGGKTSCSTLDEAKTEFTVDNGYFATYSELKKQ